MSIAKCLPLPDFDFPELPTGFTLSPPTLPEISVDANFCCKLVAFTLTIPIPLPSITLNSAFLAQINAGLAVLENYKDLIPLSCPKDP